MADTPSELTRAATEGLRRLLDGPPAPARLNAALRHLAKWRSAVLDATLAAQSGRAVLSGPFAGMDYPVKAAEGARAARLLGCYEAGLAPVIETIVARGYPLVIDVGAAEGYYAVGLARRMPQTRVLAHDSDDRAQALCRALAQANGVADRVQVAGRLDHRDFALCTAQPTVVICDIEGAEDDLLDPVAAPGLRAADILVEVHEGVRPGLLVRLADRFSATHRITRLDRRLAAEALPAWTEALNDLDRLLLLWEWRASPTPWLWMERA
ncbi:class I SAM-dependent methyltransferase [Rhodobacter sp. Har01]|uniref:class I SAM-dependent methyltransferase n=1 Tax=Rhodobacter sp. Har01 TaxID=2883999 RepID=UPI001D07318D|nr:class I SAM-dependent methyltransferase [Rhodobacter sp. Har01]MCB6177599.1 class I SAM-dependent methyltransferase [Rhodobacter sp. Har01]